MRGSIHSDQRCPLCKSRFKDDRATGLYCPNHREQQATRMIVRFGRITKRFRSYRQAFKFLNGVRHETDMGKFDIRDYSRDEPLGFENLAKEWLRRKKTTVKPGTLKGLRNHMRHAICTFQNRNIKTIGYAELEDFLSPITEQDSLFGLSDKTRANVRSTLHSFWTWLVKRRVVDSAPEFPEVSFQLKFRNTISKARQETILAELKEQTYDFNPKIWLAVKWLATYINLRPAELVAIKEKHIDLEQGRILIPDPKERAPKWVFLIDEDIQILRSMPRGFPELHFFRHTKGNGGAKPGQKFGKSFLYNQWVRACNNLGIEGVDLYGGTRHSSMIDLRRRHSPEAIKRGAGTRTNKALERYLQLTADELRPLYQDTRTDNALITDSAVVGGKKGQ